VCSLPFLPACLSWFSLLPTLLRYFLPELPLPALSFPAFPFPCLPAGGVSFPVPLYPLVQPGVLVETFEGGTHISAYVAK
jgi:hypothetical protein